MAILLFFNGTDSVHCELSKSGGSSLSINPLPTAGISLINTNFFYDSIADNLVNKLSKKKNYINIFLLAEGAGVEPTKLMR